MNRKTIPIALFLATLAMGRDLQAQFAVNWFTLHGVDGSISGGSYTLNGIAGQPDAAVVSGGGYVLQGGFWLEAIAPPMLFITLSGARIGLSWDGGGFLLQSAEEANGPWVDFVANVTTDGIHYEATTTISGRCQFFRLRGQ
jgi:hypothetical protein